MSSDETFKGFDTRCKGGIKSIIIFDRSDLDFNDDGTVRVKRPYGKFKRKATHINCSKNGI